MSRVFIKGAIYEYKLLRQSIFDIMDSISGDAIKKDSLVVIKPNLLAPAPPEKGILTHPQVVRAVAEYLIQNGTIPQISDSPALGSFEKVLEEGGFKDALKGLDVIFREFKTSVSVDIGEPFGKIEIADEALSADLLINLPKMKTHAQMLLTLGVKNLFGCIVGMRKPEWHLRTGINRKMFAQLLINIYQALSPSITILDGILSMEGQGPGKSGTPRQIGVLMGSKDAIALDITVCRMLGIEPDRLPTNKVAKEMGLVNEVIEVEGEIIEIKDFKLPDITPLIFGPDRLHGYMRKYLIQRPVSDDPLCILCGECWEYCPVQAIKHDSKKIHYDYDRCIRCYCCLEVCPHRALKVKEPLLGKVMGKFVKK